MIYRGGGWCPYTRGLTPDVVKFYNDMKPTHPEFETIYIPWTSRFQKCRPMRNNRTFPGRPWRSIAAVIFASSRRCSVRCRNS